LVRLLYLTGLVVFFYLGWIQGYEQTLYFNFGNYVVLFSYTVMLLLFMNVYGGLRVGSVRVTNLLLSSFFALLFTNFFIYFELSLIAREMLSVLPMLFTFGGQVMLAFMGCVAMNTVYYALNNARQVVAIYSGDADDARVIEKMSQFNRRFRVIEALDAAQPLDELISRIDPYDSVLLGRMDPDTRKAIFQYCYRSGKRINILPDPMEIALCVATKTQLFDTPILLCKNRELTPEQRLVKRISDIVISFLGIVALGPLMLLIALAIKMHDGGPVFYRQTRLTLGGRMFSIIKFRSMRTDSGAASPTDEGLATRNDPRITSIGALLRPYRLDEIPQLFNVLLGDMSIVGPRPEQPDFHALYMEELPEFALRLRVKAGLTGYAQIYGRYNTTPRDKLNMDLFYTEDFSILQDIRLLFMTLKILFVRESAEGFDDDAQQVDLNALIQETNHAAAGREKKDDVKVG